MQLTFLQGYPDYVGKRFIFSGYGNGPVSYSALGDPVSLPRYNNYIDNIFSATAVSGNYKVAGKPSSHGARPTWVLIWEGVGGGVLSAEATDDGVGVGMTPGTYVIDATPGPSGGLGAQIQVVVTSDVLVGPITVLNGGSGYSTPPMFDTAALGGTPPDLVATLAVEGPVPQDADLSAEVVQIGGFGGVY